MTMTPKKTSTPSSTPPPNSRSSSIASSPEVATGPSDALMQLLAPDGYYTYLRITKPKPGSKEEKEAAQASGNSVADEEKIKKLYRKLSLKHHPDRRGGDAETFRVLNRAQRVLLNPKLRKEYDLLGIDLDEADDHHDDDNDNQNEKKDGEDAGPSSPDTIVSHMATTTLAGIMQLGIRTVMMTVVSSFACVYRITLYPMLAFLLYIIYRVYAAAKVAPPKSGASYIDMASPLGIGVGLLCMHYGRNFPDVTWTFTFWFGETTVLTLFSVNSIQTQTPKSPLLIIGVAVASFFVTLWLRGRFWWYVTVIGLETFLSILAVMAFPIMEMVLEEILKEKLRKIGEKVRSNNKKMEEYYKDK